MKARLSLHFIFRKALSLLVTPLSLQPEIQNKDEGKFLFLCPHGRTFPEEVRQGSPGGERLKGIIINTG